MSVVKTCRCCQAQVTFENGVKDKTKSGGFVAICKSCNYQRVLRWKKLNPGKVKESRKREQKNKSASAKARQKEWTKKWYWNKRNSSLKDKLQISLSAAKGRAKKLKVLFDLDVDYLLSIATENCPVDGLPMDWDMRLVADKKATDRSPSLDRITPSLGYVRGNVKFIAHKWNVWKSNMLRSDLEMIIAYAQKHTQ